MSYLTEAEYFAKVARLLALPEMGEREAEIVTFCYGRGWGVYVAARRLREYLTPISAGLPA